MGPASYRNHVRSSSSADTEANIERLQARQENRKLLIIAILFYVSAGLTHVVPWLTENSGEVADATGRIWQTHDLRETTVAVMLFTMFFTAMLAMLRLMKEHTSTRTYISLIGPFVEAQWENDEGVNSGRGLQVDIAIRPATENDATCAVVSGRDAGCASQQI